MSTTESISTVEEVRAALAQMRRSGRLVGFVPTMGALHDGHMSLVRSACERADAVVVSIFVNPTQFGEGEDFEAYPRDLSRDMELLKADGVEFVFVPSTSVMYPPGAVTSVDPGPVGAMLEGVSRPGHFTGVATVVAKLFGIVQPDLAFFGEKDYQQLLVIRRIVADLDIGVRVVGCPTVREPDGLAMSSRNAYLSAEERRAALCLQRGLGSARGAAAAGERDPAALEALIAGAVVAEPLADLDYAAVRDAATLDEVASVEPGRPARALVAARVGRARLIDNVAIEV